MTPTRMRLLPLAGAFAAAAGAIAYALVALWLAHAVAVLAALAAIALAAGVRGERGLAALCDRARATGAPPPAGAGSVIGAAGALAVVLAVFAKLELLSLVDPQWIAGALITAASASRALAVAAMAGFPTHGPATGARDVAIALALGAAPVAALALWSGAYGAIGAAASLAAVTAALARRIARRRLASDREAAVGAIQLLAEVAFLAGLLAAFGVPVDGDA